MIIFENKGFQTRSDKPNSDWTGNALYVVPDGSMLAQKVMENYPYYEFVLDEAGKLIDIAPTERPEPEPEPIMPTLEERLSALESAMLAVMEVEHV